jgi:hypothetical protein
LTADPTLRDLRAELETYGADAGSRTEDRNANAALLGVAVPLRLRSEHGILSFLSTTMVFGTPIDLTLAELAIEAFFPADAATAAALTRGWKEGSQ